MLIKKIEKVSLLFVTLGSLKWLLFVNSGNSSGGFGRVFRLRQKCGSVSKLPKHYSGTTKRCLVDCAFPSRCLDRHLLISCKHKQKTCPVLHVIFRRIMYIKKKFIHFFLFVYVVERKSSTYFKIRIKYSKCNLFS